MLMDWSTVKAVDRVLKTQRMLNKILAGAYERVWTSKRRSRENVRLLGNAIHGTMFLLAVAQLPACATHLVAPPQGIALLVSHHNGMRTTYELLTANERRIITRKPIADYNLRFVYYIRRKARALRGLGGRTLPVPCQGFPGWFTATNDIYAVSTGGRKIYCIDGEDGGPLKVLNVATKSIVRTSSMTFARTGASIVYISRKEIALLQYDAFCGGQPGLNGAATRLVLYDPMTDRVTRRLQCADEIRPFRNGVALSRRISESDHSWEYSLGSGWKPGLFAGASDHGGILVRDRHINLRIGGTDGPIIARNVYWFYAFATKSGDKMLARLK